MTTLASIQATLQQAAQQLLRNLPLDQHQQQLALYAIPAALVLLICAILVFACGFRSKPQRFTQQQQQQELVGAELEQQQQLRSRESKARAGKKGKAGKDKRAANGQVANADRSSPSKRSAKAETAAAGKKSASKAAPQASVDEVDKTKEAGKQQEDNRTSAAATKKAAQEARRENKVEQAKNKKNLKNLLQEKPVDYDEGDWELAYSKKDKLRKKKEEETPLKQATNVKPKKSEVTVNNKELEKPEIKDKIAKETENKELKEKDSKEIVLTPVSNDEVEIEKEVEKVEEEPVKQSPKVLKEEKKPAKGKKGKKTNAEADNAKIVPEPLVKQEKKAVAEAVVQVEKEVVEVAAEVEIVEMAAAEVKKTEEKLAAPAFDELGDVWKEAKLPKKSKKKSRKDN